MGNPRGERCERGFCEVETGSGAGERVEQGYWGIVACTVCTCSAACLVQAGSSSAAVAALHGNLLCCSASLRSCCWAAPGAAWLPALRTSLQGPMAVPGICPSLFCRLSRPSSPRIPPEHFPRGAEEGRGRGGRNGAGGRSPTTRPFAPPRPSPAAGTGRGRFLEPQKRPRAET